MLVKELFEGKHSDAFIAATKKRFDDALVELVRDEGDAELSEKELKDLIRTVAKKHGLTGAERKKLALAAEGPIGY